MRIDSYSPLSSELQPGESSGTQPAAAAATSSTLPEDTASLSGSTSMEALSTQALAMAAQMEARVSALRAAVNSGEYSLEPSQIAEAMLSDGL